MQGKIGDGAGQCDGSQLLPRSQSDNNQFLEESFANHSVMVDELNATMQYCAAGSNPRVKALDFSTYIGYVPPWFVQSIMLSIFSAEKLIGESVSELIWSGVWLGSNAIIVLLFLIHVYKKCQGRSGLSYDMQVLCSEDYYLGYGIFLIEVIYSAVVLLILSEFSPENSFVTIIHACLYALYHMLYLKLADEYQDLAILKPFFDQDKIKLERSLEIFRTWSAWASTFLKLARLFYVFPSVVSDELEGRSGKFYPVFYFGIYLIEKLMSTKVFNEFFNSIREKGEHFLKNDQKCFMAGFVIILILQVANIFSDDFYSVKDSKKLIVFLSLQVFSDFFINKAIKTQYRQAAAQKSSKEKNDIYKALFSACGCSWLQLDFLQAFYEVFQYGAVIVATYLWTSSDDFFERYAGCGSILVVYLITLCLNQWHISQANQAIEQLMGGSERIFSESSNDILITLRRSLNGPVEI